ncbi:MAG: cobalt-precorrin 5A hydrolase, partial [Candidatus Adiutrix sp.]
HFAVSLLSGHLGGANALAHQVAQSTSGQAVISTATDLENCPALEVLARNHNLTIEDFSKLAAVSRRLVEGHTVKVYDPYAFLTPHLKPWGQHFIFLDKPQPNLDEPGVLVDYRTGGGGGQLLVMRPKVVALGLGCHRGIDLEEVLLLIDSCLKESFISPLAVALVASVETRQSEGAFLALSRQMQCPFITFSKEELSKVKTPNPSGKVLERIGVSSVCEAAAMLAAQTDRLIINKQKSARATLAAAILNLK